MGTQCFIPVRTKDEVQRVDLRDILYGHKDGRKIILHTIRGEIPFYMTIKTVTRYLDKRFLTCHYSYFINMDYITKMKEQTVYMRGNIKIHLGKETFRRGKLVFIKYLEEKNNAI